MATLIVGSLSLATYAKLHPEDGLDVGNPAFDEPIFAEASESDGQALIQHTYGNREWQTPVHLKATSKDNLHDLARDIERNAVKGARVSFLDDGATDTSYFDLEGARLELEYNHRRGLKNRSSGILRLWTRPFAHTATQRIVATGAATNAFLMQVAVASGFNPDGDVPAQAVIKVFPGSQPWGGAQSAGRRDYYGRLVAMAPLSHPSWRSIITASAINIGTVVAAAGAHASVFTTVAQNFNGINTFTLPGLAPSIYGGRRLRALAIARGGMDMELIDKAGNRLGRTGNASVINRRDWGVVDLGVFKIPEPQRQASLSDDFDWYLRARTQATNAYSSPPDWSNYGTGVNMIDITALCLLPEDEALFIADHDLHGVGMDRFRHTGVRGTPQNLNGRVDSEGYTWGPPPGTEALLRHGTQMAYTFQGADGYEYGVGVIPHNGIASIGATGQLYGHALSNVPSLAEWRIDLRIGWPDTDLNGFGLTKGNIVNVPSKMFSVWKAAASQTLGLADIGGAEIQPIVAEVLGQASGALLRLINGSQLYGSIGIPSLFLPNAELHLSIERSWHLSEAWNIAAWLDRGEEGSQIAKVGTLLGSVGQTGVSPQNMFAAVPGFSFRAVNNVPTAPGFVYTEASRTGPYIQGFRAAHPGVKGESALLRFAEQDFYESDAIRDLVWRGDGGADTIDRDLGGLSRGRPPLLQAPTTAAIAVMALPYPAGQTDPTGLKVEVRARERWSYLR